MASNTKDCGNNDTSRNLNIQFDDGNDNIASANVDIHNIASGSIGISNDTSESLDMVLDGDGGEDTAEDIADELGESSQSEDSDWEPTIVRPDLIFEEVAREGMVTEYTGISNAETFHHLFEYLRPKPKHMYYWKGETQVLKEKPKEKNTQLFSERLRLYAEAGVEAPSVKRGPPRKLELEREFLLSSMKVRAGLLNEDLAFKFKVSPALVSKTVATWLRFLAKELRWLIMWPSKGQIKLELPESFQRLYPNVRCIIDCTEVFTETPSALDIQAAMWSEYKHHCTLKFLVGITPNGAPSYVSQCYGGRASDKFIVRDCGFLNKIEPYDQIMADRGFKIKEELLMRNASLCIPPSTTAGIQMVSRDVQKTSRIANVRIYVEQAIGRLKHFRILKNVLPLNHLHLCDDIVTVVCALSCLRGPLCE